MEFIYLITNTKNSKVVLEGNLKKYWYGSTNAMSDFNYESYNDCIKFIASVIGVETREIWFLNLKRIEIGGNIKLKRKHADIIPAMKRFPRLARVTYKKGTTKFVGTKKYIIAYDKLEEVLKSNRFKISRKNKEKILKTNFVLRFEISFSGLHNSGLKEELNTFYSIRKNWNSIIEFWVDSFEKIEIEDELGDVRKIEKKSLNLTEIKEILIYQAIKNKSDLSIYETKFKKSWAFKELHAARNVKPSFGWGLFLAILFTGLDQILFRGKLPFTLKHKHADHETLKPASQMPKINYPNPDGKITFDKTSSVYLTGTNHTENQPVHLKLKDQELPIKYTLDKFDEPAQRYCPVGVYEVQRDQQNSNPKFVINSQNCIHCKTCDIKEPSQNITWVTPEGSGGPRYGNM